MTEMTLLTDQQENWVQSTLDSMSIEECAGQLLCPMMPHFSTEDWLRLLDEIPLGTLFIRRMPLDEMRSMLTTLQDHVRVPLLVAGDLEHGAIAIADKSTSFPWPMAMAAANDENLMRSCGQATAIEGRHAGLNWTFSPVIDLNLNFNNPITNIRSMGDDPDRITRLALALIEGLQQNGMLATAKHFPGDGVDDRDHHLVTSLNTLPMDQWWELYGKVWRAVIEAGVGCVMPGHIGLPDYQGYRDHPDDAPPATLDPKLLQELLREELGFDGLIVSDASPMNGLATRLPPERRVVESIKSGIDIYLFPNTVEDYRHIVEAAHSGDLPEARLRDAARRVLEAKAWLKLDEAFFGPEPTIEQTEAFQVASTQMAEQSITVIKQGDDFPVTLPAGARVLTVTIGQVNPAFGIVDLEEFDAALTQRGFTVTHMLNPTNDDLRSAAKEHDAVFVNVYTLPYGTPGTIRTVVGHFNNWGWRSIFAEHEHVYFTAFGSPYLLYETPHAPNLLATFGGAPEQQQAAVRVWLGEVQPQGSLPVRLPMTRVQRFELG
ncbi:MAG: hypothetical protein KC708_09745 [Anaerolineae bacterium]|nr:hypothetical protein [Anaerolineae bacterium]